jgi:hypothetical protein
VIYDDGVTLLDTWGALESLVDEGRSKAVYGVGLKSFRFTGIGRGRTASGKMTRLETGFGQMLDRFVECFREGDCRRPFPSLREAMTGLEEGMRKTRDTGLLSQQDLDRIRHIMEITNRYQSMADALEECSSVMQSLKLHRYTGDCAL